MIGGIHGKLLHVDLSSGRSWEEQPDDNFYRMLVGGRAVVAYLLLRDVPAGEDPYSFASPLIFAPGILQGTNFPGAGRHGLGGKSPLTGGLASSEVGGHFGHEFKRAGYDALIIWGRSDQPVYLWLHDGTLEIRPAGHLWGQLTAPTEAAIRAELGDQRIRVAQIGPAGERLVRYAAVMHDVNRAAGRNGLGALMGSKNLKAVAVRGTMPVPVVDRARVTEVSRWLGENYKTAMGWLTDGIGRGTQDLLVGLSYSGGLPTHNFGRPTFAQADLLGGERNYQMFLKERDTCQGCPVRCKQVFENPSEDPWQNLDPVYGGAEYEAMAALGSCCDISDNLAVLKANELCNAYGLDAISAGGSIAFVMECFENGVLTAADTGGLDYRWGDAAVMLRSVDLIGRREGFGDVLAEGVARMSARFGPETEPFNMTIKGQELPMHEPRLKAALGVGYAVAPVGADHMMNVHDTTYAGDGYGVRRVNAVLDPPIAPLAPTLLDEDKMRLFQVELNWRHFHDCAVCCLFYAYHYDHLADALSGITGVEYSVADVMAVGARAQTLARLYNLREGFSAADDRLPQRVMTAFAEGPLKGVEITPEKLAWAMRWYYHAMKWDPETGVPTADCIQELGLDQLLAGR
jgi:aldehyde:ferredoxin oxidoreductase